MQIGPFAGKHQFYVRQRTVAEHYAPLLRGKAYGAVKLDVLLRCVGLWPEHLGERKVPGVIVGRWSYEDLYDQVRDPPATADGRTPQQIRHLKRKWVSDQLARLVERKLVAVVSRPGRRPDLFVLRDDNSGEHYDNAATSYHDSAADKRDVYFTLHGRLIASGETKTWEAPELAAYFAALMGEFHARRGGGRPTVAGRGTWLRPLAWFNNGSLDPQPRVLLPFAPTQIERGMTTLRQRQLVTVTKSPVDPQNPRLRFNRPRNIYTNHLDGSGASVTEIPDLVAIITADLETPQMAPSDAQAAAAPPSAADILIDGALNRQRPPGSPKRPARHPGHQATKQPPRT